MVAASSVLPTRPLLRALPGLVLALSLGAPALSGQALGTAEEAERLADALLGIADEGGLGAAVEAVYDPDLPFVASRLGVNLFEGSTVIADNREPEMVAAPYDETADLTGELVWPRIDAAAAKGEDVVLRWYHYDTQEPYDFRCFSKRGEDATITVMICR